MRVALVVSVLIALGIGVLVLLRYPPVMQSVTETTRWEFYGEPAPLTTLIAEESVVKSLDQVTSPLEYFAPSLGPPEEFERVLVLRMPTIPPSEHDVGAAEEPGPAMVEWFRGMIPSLSDRDISDVIGALSSLRPELDAFAEALSAHDALRSNVCLLNEIGSSVTWVQPRNRLARAMGFAEIGGGNLQRTTWVQFSNVALCLLPLGVVLAGFVVLGRRVRRSLRRSAIAWRAGA